jgi:ADP-ribose pyrophosphatase
VGQERIVKRGELLGSSQVFDGRVLELRLERVRLPNGAECELEVIRHQGASAVVPLTADGKVLMLRQYRHATGDYLLEVPAGKLDGGAEDPEVCAHRELEEETGFRAGNLESLGWIWTTPGFSDEKIWLYLATDLRPGRLNLEADEVIELVEISLEDAVEMALNGKITDSKSICALLRAAPKLNS